MRSFVLPAFSDAHIRINLAGRESRGNVPLSEYVRTLDETEALIRECTDARTGEPIVAHVARPRECDPFDPDGPTSDLVVAFTRESDAIRHPKFGVIGPAPLMRSGEHSADGWVARAGTRRVEIDRTFAPRDLGPTMLDLAGLPPSPIHTGASFARFLA
jgi:predicted AlkP superfamily phosphohydrolase/phosphomutase